MYCMHAKRKDGGLSDVLEQDAGSHPQCRSGTAASADQLPRPRPACTSCLDLLHPASPVAPQVPSRLCTREVRLLVLLKARLILRIGRAINSENIFCEVNQELTTENTNCKLLVTFLTDNRWAQRGESPDVREEDKIV